MEVLGISLSTLMIPFQPASCIKGTRHTNERIKLGGTSRLMFIILLLPNPVACFAREHPSRCCRHTGTKL